MNDEVLKFLEEYLKKNDKFVGNGREGECSKYLIVSSDGITPIDYPRLCRIFARHTFLKEITFSSMYINWNILFIDIKFTNFGYYVEVAYDNMNSQLMPVSSVNFFNCLFDNWELKNPLVKAMTKVKFSRMSLVICEIVFIFRLLGVYWWMPRFHCS